MTYARTAGAAATIIAAVVTGTAGPARSATGDHRQALEPVVRFAHTSVHACRGRSDGFSTARFVVVNRASTRAFAQVWADRGYRAEIGSRRLGPDEWAELGEFGTTGSTADVEFHLVVRVDGETRTKVVVGRDLARC